MSPACVRCEVACNWMIRLFVHLMVSWVLGSGGDSPQILWIYCRETLVFRGGGRWRTRSVCRSARAALWRQYRQCRRNKRDTRNALAFELGAEANLLGLHRELRAYTHRPGRSICLITTGPKPRELFARSISLDLTESCSASGRCAPGRAVPSEQPSAIGHPRC